MVSKTLTLAVLVVSLGLINAAAVKEQKADKHFGVYDYHDYPHGFHGYDWEYAHEWEYGHHEWVGHPEFLHHSDNLHCFSCNENYHACRYPFIDPNGLKNQYVTCSGQCMKFRNPDDHFRKFSFDFLF